MVITGSFSKTAVEKKSQAAIKDRLLAHQNNVVVQQYCKNYMQTKAFGDEVFNAFLKFMYVSHQLKNDDIPALVTHEIVHIDYMWHSYILFTLDYQQFCNDFFNTFMHHLPISEKTPPPTPSKRKMLLTAFVSTTYKEFGKKTVEEWFVAKKFGEEHDKQVAGASKTEA